MRFIIGAYIDLKPEIRINRTSNNMALQSDAVFDAIRDRVAADQATAKKINAIFLYKITKNGTVAKDWSEYINDNDRQRCSCRRNSHDNDAAGGTMLVVFALCAALDLKSGTVYEGAPTAGTKVDTTLTVSDGDMVDIALGKTNPQVAFMKGKLKITGNIMLTQKLVPLLKTEAKL